MKMKGTSLDPTNEKLKQLKQLLPEAFAESKLDWEKLKASLGEDISFADERYVLNWAGKSNAFREIQMPTTKTLAPCKKESVDWDHTEHIFIEGENLDVLRTLQKSYYNKIKMIYIDPPYNTGNDSFIYPDNFSETKDEYLKRVGDKDEEGYMISDYSFSQNSKENGQYHSNWLNMMYPRLHLAKNLLKEDGVIFVSIDDNEVHNLGLLMNEIFGEENFVGQWNWHKSQTPPNLSQKIKKNVEYIIAYEKLRNNVKYKALKKESPSDDPFTKPQNSLKELVFPPNSINVKGNPKTIEKGVYGTEKYPNELLNKLIVENDKNSNAVKFKNKFIWTQEKLDEEIERGTVINLSKNGVLSYKKANYEPEVPPNFISHEIGNTIENAGKFVDNLLEGKYFDYPKPIELIKYLINFCVSDDDTILDFFSGSGTTAHAVMALNAEDGGNRKCISVQLAEETNKKSEAYKAGYKNIADITKERIKRAAKKIKENNPLFVGDLGMKVFKLQESNFKQWQSDITDVNELEKQIKMFIDPIAENAINENMLYELLLKSGKDLNSAVLFKDQAYYINDNELVILLDEISQDIIDSVLAVTPNKVLILDKLFKGNDQLKTNTKLQMDDAGIKFKTI